MLNHSIDYSSPIYHSILRNCEELYPIVQIKKLNSENLNKDNAHTQRPLSSSSTHCHPFFFVKHCHPFMFCFYNYVALYHAVCFTSLSKHYSFIIFFIILVFNSNFFSSKNKNLNNEPYIKVYW